MLKDTSGRQKEAYLLYILMRSRIYLCHPLPSISTAMIRKQGPSQTFQECVCRRLRKSPGLRQKLEEMRLSLAPLVQLTTGEVHPDFPPTVLHFWLLTNPQLEAMAHFYHQRTPCRWTACYPCPVSWASDLPLEEKRRKMGKFIGLRGCDTPIWLNTEEEIADEVRRHRLECEECEEEMWRKKMSTWRA